MSLHCDIRAIYEGCSCNSLVPYCHFKHCRRWHCLAVSERSYPNASPCVAATSNTPNCVVSGVHLMSNLVFLAGVTWWISTMTDLPGCIDLSPWKLITHSLSCFHAVSIAGPWHELYILIWFGGRCCDEAICHFPTALTASNCPHDRLLCVGCVDSLLVLPSTRMEIVCRQANVISSNISAIEDDSICHGRLGTIVPSLFILS